VLSSFFVKFSIASFFLFFVFFFFLGRSWCAMVEKFPLRQGFYNSALSTAYNTVKHRFLIGGSTQNSKIMTGKHWLHMTCDAFKITLEILNRSTSCQFY
jgi:hypothetical protein